MGAWLYDAGMMAGLQCARLLSHDVFTPLIIHPKSKLESLTVHMLYEIPIPLC